MKSASIPFDPAVVATVVIMRRVTVVMFVIAHVLLCMCGCCGCFFVVASSSRVLCMCVRTKSEGVDGAIGVLSDWREQHGLNVANVLHLTTASLIGQ